MVRMVVGIVFFKIKEVFFSWILVRIGWLYLGVLIRVLRVVKLILMIVEVLILVRIVGFVIGSLMWNNLIVGVNLSVFVDLCNDNGIEFSLVYVLCMIGSRL